MENEAVGVCTLSRPGAVAWDIESYGDLDSRARFSG